MCPIMTQPDAANRDIPITVDTLRVTSTYPIEVYKMYYYVL